MIAPTPNDAEAARRREAYEAAAERLAGECREARAEGDRVRLGKPTSNLFRPRRHAGERRLDVSAFDTVIAIDPGRRVADVGGMTPYDALVAATLTHGLVPAVVPELKSITVGGAVTGGGIESSSFRYGFVHETVRELDILTPEGGRRLCRPDNAHADLFHGFPNSYGTLGYALRLRVELVPAAPAVRLTHRHYADPEAFYADLASLCLTERARPGGAAFIDGAVFGDREMVRTVGEWSDDPAQARPQPFRRPYYHSMRERTNDTLRTGDYLWRWDADWFWCARAFGAEIPPVRWLLRAFGGLNSRTYWKLRHLYDRSRLLRRFGPGRGKEWVIQDVEIPADRAPAFHAFLRERIGILPFWVCPAMAYADTRRYPLYATDPDTLYINFGFWGGVPADPADPSRHNRLVEAKVAELGGMKSLYSESFFTPEAFWERYNGDAYRALKARYDPQGLLPDLYEKTVLGH